MKKLHLTIITSVLAMAFLFVSRMASADVMQLNMGGSTTTSGFYPYYTSVANSISQRFDDLNVTVVSAGGFAKNQVMLMNGDLHFGGIAPHLIADAEEKGYKKFRVLWWATPARQNIMVRKDSGITEFGQLKGKMFHPGMTGSSSQKTMLAVIKALGIQPKLYLSDSKDALNAIKNGKCLGQVKSISGDKLDAATAEVNLTTDLWPVGWTQEQQKKIKEGVPWITFEKVKAGIVKGAPEYWVHVIWVGFAATTDMKEETAYKIVKGMWEGIDEQRLAFKAVKGREIPKQTVEASSFPLHAGAVKYYREIGIDVPERLVPPEMK